MLKLKKLSFSGIGRFVEPQEIDFTDLGTLVQLDAINNVTGGSSGSGKSTVFHALEHLLGLSDLSLSVLQSRLTKDHLNVSGTFDWDGKELLIKRAKKLSIAIDGVVTEGSSKLTEELLDKILAMPRELFRQLIHRRQKEQGFFLNLKPAEMNSFLTDVLGLATVSSKIDCVDVKAKSLSNDRLSKQMDLQASQAALKATTDAIQTLGAEPVCNISEDLIKSSDAAVKDWEVLLQETLHRNKKEKEVFDVSKPNLTDISFDRTALVALESQEKILNGTVNDLLNLEKDRQTEVNKQISALKLDSYTKISSIKMEFSKKETDLKNKLEQLIRTQTLAKTAKEKAINIAFQIRTLKSGICHTCEQSWITEKAKSEEVRLLNELSAHKDTIQAGISADTSICLLKLTIDDETLGHAAQIREISEQTTIKMAELTELAKPQTNQQLVDLTQCLGDLAIKKKIEKTKEESHYSVQHVENQKLLQDFLSKQKELFLKHEAELARVRKELDQKKKDYEQANGQINTWKLLSANHKKNTESLKNKEASITSKIGHTTSEIGQLEEKLLLVEEIKRCLKLYLSCSFDDALDSISDSATRILRSVPTMANATVRLESQKETNAGAIKEQVTAYVDSDGEMGIPLKSLSGGERSAVDLAIDLAVAESIQERANAGIDIICLDEVFGGFDSIGIEHVLEMLKTFSQEKRILIVEHNDIAKEFISQKLTVVRTGETSSIKIT